MLAQTDDGQSRNREVTLEDLERVLAVGRLLLSVLTPEEIERLQHCLATGIPFSIDDPKPDAKKVTLASLDAFTGLPYHTLNEILQEFSVGRGSAFAGMGNIPACERRRQADA